MEMDGYGVSSRLHRPSISTPIPGRPNGKPGGGRCIQLSEDGRCQIFGQSEPPAV